MLTASRMLLKVRDNIFELYFQNVPEENRRAVSISDLSFILFGRTSVLFVNGFIGIALFGVNILFFLFFAQTTMSIFIDTDDI